MYEFDRQTFNSDRRYAEHTQMLSCQVFSDDGDKAGEDKSPLLVKFMDALTIQNGDISHLRGDGWLFLKCGGFQKFGDYGYSAIKQSQIKKLI